MYYMMQRGSDSRASPTDNFGEAVHTYMNMSTNVFTCPQMCPHMCGIPWGESRSIVGLCVCVGGGAGDSQPSPSPSSRAQGDGGPTSGLARLRMRRLPPARLLLGWVSSARRDAGVSECTSASSVLSAARATWLGLGFGLGLGLAVGVGVRVSC